MSCDTTQERPRPSPLRCPCQNRGVCTGDGQVQCLCPNDYEGVYCETHLLRRPTPSESVAPAYIIVPILLIILAGLAGAAVYVFFFRRAGRAKGSGFTGFGASPSVSFRQGTNVEFGPTTFSGNGSSSTMVIYSFIGLILCSFFFLNFNIPFHSRSRWIPNSTDATLRVNHAISPIRCTMPSADQWNLPKGESTKSQLK